MIGVEEERRLSPPEYQRDGRIPGWSEVYVKFRLEETFAPPERRLLMDYYRAQKRMAEGRRHKAFRIIGGLNKNPDFGRLEEEARSILSELDKNPDFGRLEEEAGSILSQITSFIRGPSEKRQAR